MRVGRHAKGIEPCVDQSVCRIAVYLSSSSIVGQVQHVLGAVPSPPQLQHCRNPAHHGSRRGPGQAPEGAFLNIRSQAGAIWVDMFGGPRRHDRRLQNNSVEAATRRRQSVHGLSVLQSRTHLPTAQTVQAAAVVRAHSMPVQMATTGLTLPSCWTELETVRNTRSHIH